MRPWSVRALPARKGYGNVSGVDISTEQTELALTLGITGITQSDLTPYLAAAPSASVGVFLLMDILEHLTREELFATVDQVFRVLTAKGRCIIHLPNAEGLFGMRIRYGDLTHELCFTSNSARQLLRTAGFQSVRCYEEKPIPHGIKSAGRRFIWDALTLLPRLLLAAETGASGSILSQNMLVVADKRP